MRRFIVKILIMTILSIAISTQATAVTRGKALSEIISALALPLWNGKSFSDVPRNHPCARYVESAFAMGILFPSDRFYPDIEISIAEALAFSFRAMGWDQEARLVASFALPDGDDLPPYLKPYVKLAKDVNPPMPESLTETPSKNLSENDLKDLTDWLRSRLTSDTVWNMDISLSGLNLSIYREGIGRPPQGWAISVSEKPTEKAASDLIKKLGEMQLPSYMSKDDCAFSVRVGPYTSYAQAWLISKEIPQSMGNTSIIPVGGDGKTVFWSILRALPSQTTITTAPSIGARRLPLSQIGKYSKSIAAVNAGFFWKDKPVGTVFIGGTPVSPTYKRRSAVGWGNNDVVFGDGSYGMSAEAGGVKIPVSAVNQAISDGEVGFYTPHFGQFATSAKGNGIEFVLKGQHVLKNRNATGSNHFMQPDETILFMRTPGDGPLAGAEEIRLEVLWNDERMSQAKQVIQAGPMILGMDGPFSAEWFSDSIVNKRHPRTIAGWDGERFCWLVIDGRSSWHSDGATLSEAAFIARQAGLKKAINMDGGGSSQMWWNGVTVNVPSEGKERPLPYAVTFR